MLHSAVLLTSITQQHIACSLVYMAMSIMHTYATCLFCAWPDLFMICWMEHAPFSTKNTTPGGDRCHTGILTPHTSSGFESSGTPAGNTEFSESQQAVTAGPEGKEGAKKGAPKDERPWLQKNWIFLIPAGMLVCLTCYATLAAVKHHCGTC